MNQSRSIERHAIPVLHSLATARGLERLLRTAIPGAADFAFIHVRSGRSLVGVAAAHHQRGQLRVLRELLRVNQLRAADASSTVALVVRTGLPQVRSSIHPDPQRTTARSSDVGSARIADLHRRLAPRSAVVVPIIVGGVVLGALSLGYADSGRRYSARDVRPAMRLASQVGDVLMMARAPHIAAPVHIAVGHGRHGATSRKRVAERN